MRQREIPTRTRENLAACTAIGLDFWSEAPPPSTLWALDEKRHPHQVRIDRRRHLVSHKENCQVVECGLASQQENWAEHDTL